MLAIFLIFLSLQSSSPGIFQDPEITKVYSGFEDGEFILKAYIGRKLMYAAKGPSAGGEPEGVWTIYAYKNFLKDKELPKQKVAEGRCIKGKRDGLWRGFFPNGRVAWEGEYRKNFLHGTFTDYFESGQVRYRGSYCKGWQTGHWVHWHENGNKQIEGDFEKDLRIRFWTAYYPSQSKLWQVNYKILKGPGNLKYSVRHGIFQSYYKGEKLATIGKYVNGLKDGQWIYYYRNGKRRATGIYVKDKKHGAWMFYNKLGKTMLIVDYNYNKKISEKVLQKPVLNIENLDFHLLPDRKP